MPVVVPAQNKVTIIPFIEFGSDVSGEGRHVVGFVSDEFPLVNQAEEFLFPLRHLAADFLENARRRCSDDYRIHGLIIRPFPRRSTVLS